MKMDDYFNQFKRINMGDQKNLPSETILLRLAEEAKLKLYQNMALYTSFEEARKRGQTHTSSLNWNDEKFHVVNKLYADYGINLSNVTNLIKTGRYPILKSFLISI